MLKVERIYTGKSMYDGDCVYVVLEDGEVLKLHADEIQKLLEDNKREVTLTKKRKYTYIELGEKPEK